jgi:predicted Zn-dependent protease
VLRGIDWNAKPTRPARQLKSAILAQLRLGLAANFAQAAQMDPLQRHRQMVERFPDNELAQFSLGKALFDLGAHAEAQEHLRRALAKKPDWMAVQILIAKCDLELGNRAAAVAGLEKARKLAQQQNHEGPLTEVEGLLADLQA